MCRVEYFLYLVKFSYKIVTFLIGIYAVCHYSSGEQINLGKIISKVLRVIYPVVTFLMDISAADSLRLRRQNSFKLE